MVAVIIIDIVGSRDISDRTAAQRRIDETLVHLRAHGPAALDDVRPTVGDELQGVYATLSDALAATLLLQLALPADIEFRFGIGVGQIESIPTAGRSLSEGPAWWAAREAIEDVEVASRRWAPQARTRVGAPDGAPASTDELVRVANAGLLARDRWVSQLSARARRLTFGRVLGRTQRELADAEGISQSAVSQALSAADSAAVVESLRALAPQR